MRYRISEEPTMAEFATYRKVDRFYMEEYVRDRIEDDPDMNPTQEQFDAIVERFVKLRKDSGEEEWNDFGIAWFDVMEREKGA